MVNEHALTVSLEGCGKLQNYIRDGSDWNIVIDNILKFKKLSNTYVHVNTVIQSMNLYNLDELIQYCNDKELNMSFLTLTNPTYLSLNAVPTQLKKQALVKLKNIKINDEKNTDENLQEVRKRFITDIQGLISIIENSEFNSELFEKFKEYTLMLDGIRSQDYKIAMPEYEKYFEKGRLYAE